MDEKKLTYKIEDGEQSFLSKAEISFSLNGFFENYEDKFEGVNRVHVELFNKVLVSPKDTTPRKMGEINDRKLIIKITFDTWYVNGKNINDSDAEVWRTLKFVMDAEVENYKKNIDKLNPALRTRLNELEIDLSNEKNVRANDLKGSLGTAKYLLDFDARIGTLSDEDLYQLGTSILSTSDDSQPYFKEVIISEMSKKLESNSTK